MVCESGSSKVYVSGWGLQDWRLFVKLEIFASPSCFRLSRLFSCGDSSKNVDSSCVKSNGSEEKATGLAVSLVTSSAISNA